MCTCILCVGMYIYMYVQVSIIASTSVCATVYVFMHICKYANLENINVRIYVYANIRVS